MEDAFGKGSPVFHEDLETSAGPTHTLYPGLGELDGLLVVDDGFLAVCDLLAVADVVDSELDIFRQKVERVSVHLLCDPAVEHKARAGYAAARMQEVAGTVKILGLTQEPEGVACRCPAVTVVLAVPVAGDYGMTLIMGDVHFLDVFGIDNIIGVEYEVSVKSFGIVLLDLLEEEVQSITLTDVLIAVALIYDGTPLPGDLSSPVVAVVSTDEDLDLLVRVVLVVDAVDEIADDELLVAGADQESICIFDDLLVTVLFFFLGKLVLYGLEK